MDIKNFVLSYYKNSTEFFHIQKVEKSFEARKPHTHDYFQIYYIIKGNLIHFVENESSTLTRGNMFIIPPGAAHYITPQKDTVFYSFSFMPDFLGEPGSNNKLAANFLKNLQSSQKQKIRPKVAIEYDDILYVQDIFKHILTEFTQKNPGFSDIIRAYSLVLVTILARNYYDKVKISSHFEDSGQFVLHCIDYIENNFADDISLNEMTRRSAMSKGSFCSLFHELTGHTFNSYLNYCRINKAKEYIEKGYKITAVYGLCGYNDFSTFYRNFKKVMGISPKEYKLKQH